MTREDKIKRGTLAVVMTSAPNEYIDCRGKLVAIVNINDGICHCSWVDTIGYPQNAYIPLEYLWHVDTE